MIHFILLIAVLIDMWSRKIAYIRSFFTHLPLRQKIKQT